MTRDTILAAKRTDFSPYVLIFSNFINLPDVAELSENSRYLFTPPEGSHTWKGGMTREIHGPILALQFGRGMYNPDGWMIGSSDNTDQCDMQIAAAGDRTGISRRHFQIDIDVESKAPRLTHFSPRNPLVVVVHETTKNRQLVLTKGKSVNINTDAPITIHFGTSSFQAWRPILTSPAEMRSYHQHLEKYFEAYFDAMLVIPSTKPLSGVETLALRFGQNGTIYKRGEELGKGTNGTVFQVVELISKNKFAAKEPYYKASDSSVKRVERFGRLNAEYRKLVELKHPHIVEAVELLLIADDIKLPPWMIMEYIDDSLDKAFHRLNGARCLVIVPQIIEAVNFMHDKNYVHRDIKPGNILVRWVDDQPFIKMADVGTMKEDDSLKTFAGTPLYMAPEYWSKPPRYGKEVDMWAVGLVLLQLFTDWDPATDTAWVHGPHGTYNGIGFSAWISGTLSPLIATAVPRVQQLLKGLLCESPNDRWTAPRCQEWMEEDDTVGANEEA